MATWSNEQERERLLAETKLDHFMSDVELDGEWRLLMVGTDRCFAIVRAKEGDVLFYDSGSLGSDDGHLLVKNASVILSGDVFLKAAKEKAIADIGLKFK